MRFLIRWAIRFFIISVVLVVALVLLKDTLLKAFAEYSLRTQTGLEVRIGRFELGLGSPQMTIEDLKVYNSAEFGGSPLVDVSELHLECDARALASQELHLKLLRLNLNEVNIFENREGRTNLTVLLERLQKKTGETTDGTNRVFGMKFQGIDTLNLTVGKVTYSSLKNPGRDVTFDVGLKSEILTNVHSMNDLSGLLLTTIFRRGISISNNGAAFSLLPGTAPSPVTGKPGSPRPPPASAKGASPPKTPVQK